MPSRAVPAARRRAAPAASVRRAPRPGVEHPPCPPTPACSLPSARRRRAPLLPRRRQRQRSRTSSRSRDAAARHPMNWRRRRRGCVQERPDLSTHRPPIARLPCRGCRHHCHRYPARAAGCGGRSHRVAMTRRHLATPAAGSESRNTLIRSPAPARPITSHVTKKRASDHGKGRNASGALVGGTQGAGRLSGRRRVQPGPRRRHGRAIADRAFINLKRAAVRVSEQRLAPWPPGPAEATHRQRRRSPGRTSQRHDPVHQQRHRFAGRSNAQ